MSCCAVLDHEDIKAGISARLDGEEQRVSDAVIDAHLAYCGECAAFQDRAVALSRTLKGERHGMTPPQDLADAILVGVEPRWRVAASARQIHLIEARLGMAALGVLCVVWAFAGVVDAANLVTWVDHGHTLSPSARPELASALVEVAALRFGLASGLFFATWKPSLAPGMLPVVTTMAMFLLGITMRDIALNMVSMQRVYTLLVLVAALLLLLWVWMADKGYLSRAWWRHLAASPVSND